MGDPAKQALSTAKNGANGANGANTNGECQGLWAPHRAAGRRRMHGAEARAGRSRQEGGEIPSFAEAENEKTCYLEAPEVLCTAHHTGHRPSGGIILGPVYAMLRRLPLFLVVLLAALSYAYIPAVNSTAQGVADTENSTITLKWPSGTFQETISYQLAASGSMGISKVCPFSC